MFLETIKNKYGCDVPVFTKEILDVFPQYTKAYIFRMIKKTVQEGSLKKLDTGVYYIPKETPFGPSVLSASDVAKKRYIESGNEIYGIYGGLTLLNEFYVTTQMANILEIITNRESTCRRTVVIDGMAFIIRKSRTKITKENADTYRVLQLLTEAKNLSQNARACQAVLDYVNRKKISREFLLDMAQFFPSVTYKNLVCSGVA